jgi:hypothetical protein
MRQQLDQERLAYPAYGGATPAAIETLTPPAQRRYHAIDDHISRSSIEGQDILEASSTRKKGQIGNAADVLHQARPGALGK